MDPAILAQAERHILEGEFRIPAECYHRAEQYQGEGRWFAGNPCPRVQLTGGLTNGQHDCEGMEPYCAIRFRAIIWGLAFKARESRALASAKSNHLVEQKNLLSNLAPA